MSKKVKISQILIYYDLPELFIAIDDVNINYLCLLTNINYNNLNYISVSISNKRLDDFLQNKIDLKYIFENPENKQWFIINDVDFNSYFNIIEYKTQKIQSKFLPEENFYINFKKIEEF